MEFQRLEVLPVQKWRANLSDAKRFWARYKTVLQGKQTGAVGNVSFLPVSPFDPLVASSTTVYIYDAETNSVRKKLSMFKQVVTSCCFRPDGRLLVVGDESGVMRAVETSTKNVLRRLKGHLCAVHACQFAWEEKVHLMSGGDDAKLVFWDLSDGTKVAELSGHNDFVRSLAALDQSTWASGSYDGTVKLWDVRRAQKSAHATLHHEAGVEKVASVPRSQRLLSASAHQVAVWDTAKLDKPLFTIKNHMKTVTGLCVTSDGGGLVTASLDETIKWQDMKTHKVLHTYRPGGPVLCLALSPHDDAFAAGTADGAWSVRRRRDDEGAKQRLDAEDMRTSNRQAMLKTGAVSCYFKRGRDSLPSPQDSVVSNVVSPKLSKIDKLLRSFRYKAALDFGLRTSDQHALSVLEELVHRRALYVALRNRTDRNSLVPLLTFLYKQIGKDYVYLHIVVDTLNTLLSENCWDQCAADALILEALRRVEEKISSELQQQRTLQSIQGVLDLILAAQ